MAAAAEPLARRRRCATYTRKSSDEGLEQDFNSLHAQREACEAYIRSQAGEGWRPVATAYDDGGFSGGTLERPGLARLLSDIQGGRVDTVVVYKVDRLTRSLADFARIVEIFDSHGVSFVSVTQQFNTTTSMGRLTLNMLLSFAQFEREVTGERIRDKIAASKRKGMWMGGPVPLGYEPQGRTLVIQEEEAQTVRSLFQRYLALGSVRRVKEEADRRGLVSKRRPGCKVMRGGRSLSRGTLYNLLGNPLYAGRVRHEGKTYEGQHPAIVDVETWEAVQAKLAAQTRRKRPSPRAGSASPLRGKLFDENGGLLTPTHAVKAGRRYRYYVSKVRAVGSARGSSSSPRHHGWRLPAREIEARVQDAVTALLGDRATLAGQARQAGLEARRLPDLLGGVDGWAGTVWELLERVELRPEEVTVQIDLSRFVPGEALEIRYGVPTRLRRRGVETRLVLEGGASRSGSSRPDPALVRAVVRAHRWFEDLVTGRVSSLREIARIEGVTASHVRHVLPLAFLAPDLVAAILAGTQPVELSAEALIKRVDLPLSWKEQRLSLGLE